MTPLQRERLDAALKAILAAGGHSAHGHLADRLRRATTTGSDGRWPLHEVLVQARAWASIVRSEDDPKRMAAARDAIGALWAVQEDPTW